MPTVKTLHFMSRRGEPFPDWPKTRMPGPLPWPVLHEFLAIVTHPKIYRPPSSMEAAFGFLESLMESPGLRLLAESSNHLAALKQLAVSGKISGSVFHDARIAAICLTHGVRELWSADRDLSRMKGLKIRNPLMR